LSYFFLGQLCDSARSRQKRTYMSVFGVSLFVFWKKTVVFTQILIQCAQRADLDMEILADYPSAQF
jgi:hypothetical protein